MKLYKTTLSLYYMYISTVRNTYPDMITAGMLILYSKSAKLDVIKKLFHL